MTPATVSSADMSAAIISMAKTNAPSPAGVPAAGAASTKGNVNVPVDTVNISSQSRHASSGAKNPQSPAEKEKMAETKNATDDGTLGREITAVQFVYNPKGELSIKFMDSASRVVYQTPSELMLRLKEAAAKLDSAVDTKA